MRKFIFFCLGVFFIFYYSTPSRSSQIHLSHTSLHDKIKDSSYKENHELHVFHNIRFTFWNILVDLAFDKWFENGIEPWYLRKQAVKQFIVNEQADILGFAEALPWQSNGIQDVLPGYKRVQYDDFTDAVIFYRKNKFQELDSGWFFLSNRPHESWSTDYGNFMPRILVWVKLRACSHCAPFVVMTTHLDGMKPARLKMVQQLRSLLETQFKNDAVVLMGDFNISFSDEGYQLMEQSHWKNSYFLAGNKAHSTHPTRGLRQIDHIFLIHQWKGLVKPLKWSVAQDKFEDHILSDHRLVSLDVKINMDSLQSRVPPKATLVFSHLMVNN